MADIQIDPKLINFLILLPLFFISIAFHEFAHGFVAHKFGDDTAKNAGRLTLNPIKHIDIFGTIIVPIFAYVSGMPVIGWAKPVPVDRRNFKNPLKDDLKVSFAGPFSNFLLSVLVLIIFIILFHAGVEVNNRFGNILIYGIYINIFLFLFNILPIPPLDGSYIVYDIFPNKVTAWLLKPGFFGIFLLMFLIYSPLWKYFMQFVNIIFSTYLHLAGFNEI
ncbi:MAG: site-2 protease family protein [Syntrophothermus sp.]